MSNKKEPFYKRLSLSSIVVIVFVAFVFFSNNSDLLSNSYKDLDGNYKQLKKEFQEEVLPVVSERFEQEGVDISNIDSLEDLQTLATSDNKPNTNSELDISYLLNLEYQGEAVVSINDNIPFFTDEEISIESFEYYSELDDLGRPGVCVASIGTDLMPEGDRDFSLSGINPPGWINKQYDCIDNGGWLYNRCHLIGWQLTAEELNRNNLITGTRYLNIDGMLWQENAVANYLKDYPDAHVMYRVTPIYSGNELVARGLLIEAESVEDNGTGLEFCYYCFNVQPGIEIDYLTGESWEAN